jgi:hypothetical protein
MSPHHGPEDATPHRRHELDVAGVCVILRSSRYPVGTRIPGRIVAISAGGFEIVPSAPLGAGDVVRLVLRTASAAGVEPEAIVLGVGDAPQPLAALRFSQLQPGLAIRIASLLGLPQAA